MKRIAVAVLLFTLLGLAACGGDDEATTPAWAKVSPEQIAQAQKHGVPVAFENEIGMRFVLIPAGTFLMGSPEDAPWHGEDETQHEVTITKPFYLATTETTESMWTRIMERPPLRPRGSTLPVADVSWEDCQLFVQRLNEETQGGTHSLPTEAEWEYACRAGTTTPFSFGKTLTPDLAAVRSDASRESLLDTPLVLDRHGSPIDDRPRCVGSFPSNAWGLHDMHGNLYEWSQDALRDYPAGPLVDPVVDGDGYRVYRGGFYLSGEAGSTSATRAGYKPEHRCFAVGFRVTKAIATD